MLLTKQNTKEITTVNVVEQDKGKKQKTSSKLDSTTPKKKRGLKYMIMHPMAAFRKTDGKREAFMKLIDNHIDFFKHCQQIDCHLVAMAYTYFQRAKPSLEASEYTSELLFYFLYLAWETEEDSTVGVEGIIHYVVGRYPSSRNKDSVMRKYEILEWKRKLRQFHAGKDILWRALDFNTYVDHNLIQKTLLTFPDHDVYRRQRQDHELVKYF